MSASNSHATSTVALWPNAAPLDVRALTRELGKARSLHELLSLQKRHRDRFNSYSLSAFWSKFKKLPHKEPGELQSRLAPVCEQTVRMVPELNARTMATVAHVFATSRLVGTYPYTGVWEALEEAARRGLGYFNDQDLSSTR